MTAAAGPPRGLQAERTELSWERTALGAFGAAALLTTRLPAAVQPVDLLPPAAALLLALALAVVGRWRRRQLTARDRPVRAANAAILITGAGATAVGTMIVVLSLLSPGR
jgi:putative membrane protein